MANTYAYRTMDLTANGGYTSRFVFSAWVKRSKLSYSMAPLFSLHKNNSNTASRINCYFDNNDNLLFKMKDSGGSDDSFYATNRVFRDTNSWYHIYLAYNSTLSTAADRLQIYVNGVRETSFSSANEVGSNFDALMSSSMDFRIGLMKENDGTAYYFDGLMNSAIFTNYQSGTVDPVTDFGEVDSTTGEWKINVSPSVTYATQGVFVLKNGNSLTDQSGQSNNMTVGGTLTSTKDCPSNVFATMTPTGNQGNYRFNNGNTTVDGDSNNNWAMAAIGTVGANSGKYYWEIKLGMYGGNTDYNITGVVRSDKSFTNSNLYSNGGFNGLQSANSAGGLGIYSQTNASMGGALYIGGSSVPLTNGDIVMYALDLDNRKLWVGKNGTWADDGNSGYVGNPSTGAYPLWGTGEITAGEFYLPASIQFYNSDCSFNFGNGYFRTTAVSSEGTSASTPGIFEYDCPSGFQPWSTKGLNA